MATSAVDRLHHIKTAVDTIRHGLSGLTLESLNAQPIISSGFRYQLLVISEAARHLPTEWKETHGGPINWRRLEDLGNRLRHAYQDTNLSILWAIYENDLGPLEIAVERMIAAYGPTSPRRPSP